MTGNLKTPGQACKRLALIVTFTVAAVIALSGSNVATAQAPADFVDQRVVGGMKNVTALDWLPDGRALVAGKGGEIYLVNPSNGTSILYLTVPNLDDTGERGLLDILIPPDFSATRTFYVYFSATPNGRLHIDSFRFTGAPAADLASRRVVWTNPGPTHDQFGEFHAGGSLNLAPDNTFYLSVGDGYLSSNAETLTTVFGKILRINRDGTVPSNNPFHDGAGPNIDEIWAYGLRNPYRASFDGVTGRYYIGDVGGNVAAVAYEEVNVGVAGANYGWPSCEGPLGNPKNGSVCPGGVQSPIFTYPHAPEAGCCLNAAITGGEVMRSGALPSSLSGAYVYADFALQQIRYLRLAANGTSVTGSGTLAQLSDKFPTWIGEGPDGHIYYLSFGYVGSTGELRRLQYVGAQNRPPDLTAATADRRSGVAPLVVAFSASATDADGDALAYRWDFGDGSAGYGPTATHTYSAGGRYEAFVVVTAAGQTDRSDPIVIDVGQPPTARITAPQDQSTFSAGQTLRFTSTSADDEPLTNSNHSWNLGFVHDNHVHPVVTDHRGRSLTYTVPTDGHDYNGETGFLATLSVTDSDGLVATDSIGLRPQVVALTVDTARLARSRVVIDGVTYESPVAIQSVANFEHTVTAPAQGCKAGSATRFTRWSNNMPLTHTFVMPSDDLRLVAIYDIQDQPCTGRPIASFTTAAPTARVSNEVMNFNGLVTDDRSVARVEWRVRDNATGLYLSDPSGSFESGVGWLPLTVPDSENQLVRFGFSFEPPQRGGSYRVQVRAIDDQGRLSRATYQDITVASAEVPTCLGKKATVVLGANGFGSPTSGNDVIVGTRRADRIDGLGGHDVICGRNGADTIRGGAGNDIIDGGGGDDTILGGVGTDYLAGGNGDDLLQGGGGNDIVFGGNGDDIARGGRGRDTMAGDAGEDTLAGGAGADTLYGNDDKDTISGGDGNDALYGGNGTDLLYGEDGDDFLGGAADFDACFGGEGDDTYARCEFRFESLF